MADKPFSDELLEVGIAAKHPRSLNAVAVGRGGFIVLNPDQRTAVPCPNKVPQKLLRDFVRVDCNSQDVARPVLLQRDLSGLKLERH
jgi:hypothetical protein